MAVTGENDGLTVVLAAMAVQLRHHSAASSADLRDEHPTY